MTRFGLLLAALLAASCGSARVERPMMLAPASQARTVKMIDEVPTPTGSRLVYDIDPQCAAEPIGYTLPRTAAAACWQTAARDYLKGEVVARRVIPGPNWLCYRYATEELQNCIEMVFRPLPEIHYGVSAQWVSGTIGGAAWNGCAAGQAREGYVFVYLGEPARVLKLVAWETTNHFLAYVMDQLPDGDGPIVTAATNHAAASCPAE